MGREGLIRYIPYLTPAGQRRRLNRLSLPIDRTFYWFESVILSFFTRFRAAYLLKREWWAVKD